MKIILEIAQMLYTAHWVTAGNDDSWIEKHTKDIELDPYRKTHFNHPTAKWVRYSLTNYLYACEIGLELCYEYTRRYGKIHKTQARLVWLRKNIISKVDSSDYINSYLADTNLPEGCTPIPLAMPAEYHCKDAVEAYKNYYIGAKSHVQTASELQLKLQ